MAKPPRALPAPVESEVTPAWLEVVALLLGIVGIVGGIVFLFLIAAVG